MHAVFFTGWVAQLAAVLPAGPHSICCSACAARGFHIWLEQAALFSARHPLSVLQAGVTIKSADTAFPTSICQDGVYKIMLGDLYAEEKKDLLVKLQVRDPCHLLFPTLTKCRQSCLLMPSWAGLPCP